MNKSALLIVDEASSSGLRGRLVDVEAPEADWVRAEVRFGKPERDRSRGYREQSELDATEDTRRAAFARAVGAAETGAMLRLEYPRGDWDPAQGRGFLSAYGAVKVCTPAETLAVLALPRREPELPGEEAGLWQSRSDSPFFRRVVALADPEWTVGRFVVGPLAGEGYEGECCEAEARHQHEGLLYVAGRDRAILLDHHGSYLFYADGTDARDAGLKHGVPDEPGLYYFTGSPWGYGPDINGEYDSGIDVTAVPATAAHYALFGTTCDDYREAIEEFDAECADEHSPSL
jgi:hypothetical protein